MARPSRYSLLVLLILPQKLHCAYVPGTVLSAGSPRPALSPVVGAVKQFLRVAQVCHALRLVHRPHVGNLTPARHVRLHRHLSHYAYKKLSEHSVYCPVSEYMSARLLLLVIAFVCPRFRHHRLLPSCVSRSPIEHCQCCRNRSAEQQRHFPRRCLRHLSRLLQDKFPRSRPLVRVASPTAGRPIPK